MKVQLRCEFSCDHRSWQGEWQVSDSYISERQVTDLLIGSFSDTWFCTTWPWPWVHLVQNNKHVVGGSISLTWALNTQDVYWHFKMLFKNVVVKQTIGCHTLNGNLQENLKIIVITCHSGIIKSSWSLSEQPCFPRLLHCNGCCIHVMSWGLISFLLLVIIYFCPIWYSNRLRRKRQHLKPNMLTTAPSPHPQKKDGWWTAL